MKILQIGSALYSWGGIERYVAYLSKGLTDRGHDVHVTAPAGSPLAKRATGTVHEIPQPSQFSLRSIGRYRKLFRHHEFDAINVHFSPDYVIPVRVARMMQDCPILMTRHLASAWSKRKAWTYRTTIDQFIAVSAATKNALVTSGIPSNSVTVAHAGCESINEVGDVVQNDDWKFKVGFFGRLTVEKGVDVLIRSLQLLPPEVELHVFGDGPASDELKVSAPTKRVTFHGFVENVESSMRDMDVIAIPSRWAEAFPFSGLEAMAAGKPIVASRVGGIPEQIEHEKSGLLVEPDDPSALSISIDRLRNDRQLSLRLGSSAKLRQQEQFTIDAFAERIERVYLEIVAARNLRGN